MSEIQATIDELWDWEDPSASESRFRAAADAASGVERDVLLTQVARARGLAGNFAGAGEILDALPADVPEIRVRVLLERGRLLNSADDAAAARPRSRPRSRRPRRPASSSWP